MDDELFTTEMAYDPAGRVTTIHHHHDVSGVPQTLARFDYTVDARGNRTQAVEQRQPSGGGSLQPQTHVYTYDGVERVTGATTYPNATPTGTPIRTFAYGYDLAGNGTSAALNGTPTSYTYNNRNQLTSDGTHTFSYDKNGNRISDGTLTTVWDRAGRMLSHDGHSYAYDGEGRRIAQTAGGSTTRYVLDVQRGLPAVIGAKAGSDMTHYMHGPLGMFAQRNPDASWDWMLHDGLGSVRGVFDGTLQSAAEYDPFGEPIVSPIGTAYGFTGEMTDGNGLVYLRARYLAPALGTFASRDPWRGSASAPRTWNGYAWVEGNVVNRVDPGGMQSITSTPTPTPTVSCSPTPQPALVSTPPVATSTPDPTLLTASTSQSTISPQAAPRPTLYTVAANQVRDQIAAGMAAPRPTYTPTPPASPTPLGPLIPTQTPTAPPSRGRGVWNTYGHFRNVIEQQASVQTPTTPPPSGQVVWNTYGQFRNVIEQQASLRVFMIGARLDASAMLLGVGVDVNLELHFVPHHFLPQYWGRRYVFATALSVGSQFSLGKTGIDTSVGPIVGSVDSASVGTDSENTQSIGGGNVSLPFLGPNLEIDVSGNEAGEVLYLGFGLRGGDAVPITVYANLSGTTSLDFPESREPYPDYLWSPPGLRLMPQR